VARIYAVYENRGSWNDFWDYQIDMLYPKKTQKWFSNKVFGGEFVTAICLSPVPGTLRYLNKYL